nr:hypothetical protein [Bryobacterales bacterium]
YPLYESPEALSVDFDLATLADTTQGSTEQQPAVRPRTADTTPRSAQQAPVVIQVNAMDARSFADHRDEIASAVREALTRNHALRDEIWED